MTVTEFKLDRYKLCLETWDRCARVADGCGLFDRRQSLQSWWCSKGHMNPLTFLGAVLLGLGSSLHCAGMCGGIAASLVLGLNSRTGARSQLEILCMAHAGKAVAYVAAGAVLGGIGAGVYGLFDRHIAYFVLQRVSSLGIGWVGLSFLGIAPPMSLFDRWLSPVRTTLATLRFKGTGAVALFAGLGWGLMPCGIVYSALFYAMLSGTAVSGASVMLGFALGVTPAVIASAMGVTSLPLIGRRAGASKMIGASLVAIALATLIWPMPSGQVIC